MTELPEDDPVLSIVLTGVESTGKTALSRFLAERLGAPWVAERARAWLSARGNHYVEADLLELARLQDAAEAQARRRAAAQDESLVVVDTDLTVIRIWAEVRFGRCAPEIERQLRQRPRALYVLPSPDLPWEADPQRENPHGRDALHARYRALLREQTHPWAAVSGQGAIRYERAWQVVRAAGAVSSGC